jgi:hypothetical protein
MRDQVSYYLNRARAAVRARTLGAATEVAPAVEALVRTFEKIYAERAIDFTVSVPGPFVFKGNARISRRWLAISSIMPENGRATR